MTEVRNTDKPQAQRAADDEGPAARNAPIDPSSAAGKAVFKDKTREHPNFARGKHKVNFDAVNHDFRKKLWDGQLPVKITLGRNDISVAKEPKPLYVMLPRLNYFTYILEKVKTVYDEYVSIDCVDNFQDMWFDFNGQALRWEVPIGVQFDTLIGLGGESRDKGRDLPWELQFHYKGAPDDIIKLHKVGGIIDISYCKFSYINSLKESHVLRMGSAHEILAQMKKSEEEKLFSGIQKHNYEQFWEINQLLCDKHVADMKKYAVRVYSNRYNRFVQPSYEIP